MIIPIILCGGVGSRLWPLSRGDNPKQFLKLQNNKSLLQETILRVSDSSVFAKPIIICREKDKFKVAAELEEIKVRPYAILLEPCQRNTAPAITAAAVFIKKQFKESQNMLVLPADHSIRDKEKFIGAVNACKDFSEKGIITFGISPTYAATGYGYIKMGDTLSKKIYKVEKFIEKPNLTKAKAFLESKDYFWNSGMFLMNNDVYLQDLEKLQPRMLALTKTSVEKIKQLFDFFVLNGESFSKTENISVDVAVLEKTKNALLCPIKIDWLDLGNWESVYTSMKRNADKDGNVVLGQKIYANKSTNSLIYSDGKKHLAINKVENLCVINTGDAVLITHKDHTEDIKEIYSNLKKTNADILQKSNKSYRPWGYYEVILDTPTYKIKRIYIAPGQQISLQYHLKRSEHWIITKGIATVTKVKETFKLKKNESILIPIKEIHKIANNTSNELEFIEVQIGESLTEDDIVRLEDKYGRIESKKKTCVCCK